MKKLLASALIAATMSTPAISDEFMHKETGRLLDLIESDVTERLYFTGFIDGVVWGSCTIERTSEFLRRVYPTDLFRFMMNQLRFERNKGTFYNSPNFDMDGRSFLKSHIKAIICGELDYE